MAVTFDQLRATYVWRPIANCPGRFVCDSPVAHISPRDLVDSTIPLQELQVPHARDTVVIAAIEGGGLISYRRADGRHVHTLNTPEGFARKLRDLGVGAAD
jgi:hypothetical protein